MTDSMGAMNATGATADASAVVATNVVTNGPIADTPENRDMGSPYLARFSGVYENSGPSGSVTRIERCQLSVPYGIVG